MARSTVQTSQPDPPDLPDELAGLSYEQAREELLRVVQQLESGGSPLAESLVLWERGERLATVCQNWLDGARAKVEAAQAGEQAEGEQGTTRTERSGS